MARFTQTQITRKKAKLVRYEGRLDDYRAAEQKVLQSQEYIIGNRTMTRADLEFIQSQIDILENKVDELYAQIEDGGSRKAFTVVMRDR